MVEYGVKQRTKYLHLPYGDQCLFFHRDAYKESGGFKHVPFMEVGQIRTEQIYIEMLLFILHHILDLEGGKNIESIVYTHILHPRITTWCKARRKGESSP